MRADNVAAAPEHQPAVVTAQQLILRVAADQRDVASVLQEFWPPPATPRSRAKGSEQGRAIAGPSKSR
eukprot:6470547-Pyramimonas_sp.AAC.1